MNERALSWPGMDFARAPDTLRSIAHDSKAHPLAVGVGVKSFPVVLYRQYHLAIAICELDQYFAGSTMFDGITHCLLRDPIKLSCRRRANRQCRSVGGNDAFHMTTVADIHGQRLQRSFQVPHSVGAFETTRSESDLPGCLISEAHYGRRLFRFGRPI